MTNGSINQPWKIVKPMVIHHFRPQDDRWRLNSWNRDRYFKHCLSVCTVCGGSILLVQTRIWTCAPRVHWEIFIFFLWILTWVQASPPIDCCQCNFSPLRRRNKGMESVQKSRKEIQFRPPHTMLNRRHALSLGWAPTPSQYFALDLSSVTSL